jgi:Leucine-rich repeat (LRR) protein
MNFIVQFDDMSLPNLDTLKLPGNQLTFLPSLKGFPRLREFDIARNQITSVTRIVSEGGLQYLERLKGSFNQLSGEYLDEFCFVLQNLPNLLEVDFKGNDMSLVKDYQLKILKAKKLRVLDNMMLSDTVIQNMIV